MGNQRSFKTTGWKVSAILAVPYVLVMLAGLILVGYKTTGSWRALFLGVGLNNLIGFEIGFFGVIVAGFAISGMFVPIYNWMRKSDKGEAITLIQSRKPSSPWVQSWPARMLGVCFALPPLALLGLRLLAMAGILGNRPSAIRATPQVPEAGLQPVSLSSAINTAYRESEPSFTNDGQTMYFNCMNGDICVSHLTGRWEEGRWTTPERLDAPVSTEYEDVEPLINGDGDKLYFMSNRPGELLGNIPFLSPFINVAWVANSLVNAKFGQSFFGGLGSQDVYISHLVNGKWSKPQSLNDLDGEPPVNTPFADHCLFFSIDGDEAFWTSTRPGGFGGNDIWTSRRVNGRWTAAENLGPNVNGPGDEHASIPTPDGLSLYVTATRSEGFGGEDIYVTTRSEGGKWGLLANLGSMINGPGDDRCPAWTPDHRVFLFDSIREGGFGARDIWWVYFKDVKGFPHAEAHTSSAISVSGSHVPENFVP